MTMILTVPIITSQSHHHHMSTHRQPSKLSAHTPSLSPITFLSNKYFVPPTVQNSTFDDGDLSINEINSASSSSSHNKNNNYITDHHSSSSLYSSTNDENGVFNNNDPSISTNDDSINSSPSFYTNNEDSTYGENDLPSSFYDSDTD